MALKVIRLQIQLPGALGINNAIAYRYSNEVIWRDPWGGVFNDQEIASFERFIAGETDFVLVANKTLCPRLVVRWEGEK